METPLPEYVGREYNRNVEFRPVYCRLIRAAYGQDVDVKVSHHIFVSRGENDVTEIPAADTILFCHDLMTRVFRGKAQSHMVRLAQIPREHREHWVRRWLDEEGHP